MVQWLRLRASPGWDMDSSSLVREQNCEVRCSQKKKKKNHFFFLFPYLYFLAFQMTAVSDVQGPQVQSVFIKCLWYTCHCFSTRYSDKQERQCFYSSGGKRENKLRKGTHILETGN